MRREISSRSNPRLTEFLRRRESFFIFEGEKLVRDLLDRCIRLDILVQAADWRGFTPGISPDPVEHWIVSQAVMRKMSDLKTPAPVLAALRHLPQAFDWGRGGLVAALNDIQDPANLGSIFRCASAFGVDGLVLCGECAHPNHPKVVRAAQTALFDIPFDSSAGLEAVVASARSHGFSIYFTAPRPGPKSVAIGKIRKPALVVFGSEGQGFSEEWLREFPTVTVPQEAKLDSLNVAVAACIIFYEMRRIDPDG